MSQSSLTTVAEPNQPDPSSTSNLKNTPGEHDGIQRQQYDKNLTEMSQSSLTTVAEPNQPDPSSTSNLKNTPGEHDGIHIDAEGDEDIEDGENAQDNDDSEDDITSEGTTKSLNDLYQVMLRFNPNMKINISDRVGILEISIETLKRMRERRMNIQKGNEALRMIIDLTGPSFKQASIRDKLAAVKKTVEIIKKLDVSCPYHRELRQDLIKYSRLKYYLQLARSRALIKSTKKHTAGGENQ